MTNKEASKVTDLWERVKEIGLEILEVEKQIIALKAQLADLRSKKQEATHLATEEYNKKLVYHVTEWINA
jgi:hypothetical protein